MPDRRHLLLLGLLVLASIPADAWASGVETFEGLDAAKLRGHKQRDHVGYAPAVPAAAQGASETEPNDVPGQADDLVLGEPLAANLVTADVDWFAVTCGGSEYVTVSTAPRDGSVLDTIVRVYDGDLNLLAQDDDAGVGLFSAVQHVACGADLLVEVVSFGGTGVGAYWVTVESGTPPPPAPANDQLAGVIDVECNSVWKGTTLGSTDDVGAIGCVPYQPLGGEVFYRITVPYSYQLNVQVMPDTPFDPSVYLFTDPSRPEASCVAGSDVGFFDEPELLAYVMDEDPHERPVTLYIAVDSWSAYSAGDFTLALSCEFVVATEASTWGAVKARF
jgi:hypothetical protein